MASTEFVVDYAPSNRATCRKCKERIVKGSLRIGKTAPNFFSSHGSLTTQFFHPEHLMDSFKRAKPKTKTIKTCDDLKGFDAIRQEDKAYLQGLMPENPSL